jgi:sensor histidine kinase YesM
MFVLALKQFSTIYFIESIPFVESIVDTFISISFLALLAIALWYNIRYSKNQDKLNFAAFFNYLGMIAIFSLIWVSVSYNICFDIFAKNPIYIEFLKRSLPWRFLISFFLFSNAATMYLMLLYYDNLKEKQKSEVSLLEKVKESELNMLKSQINPHFLFNSLNSISSLTMSDPDKAQSMVIKLSDYLRYSISNNESRLQDFKSELDNIKRYLEIETVRFGEKLKFDFNIDPQCLKAKIPVMLMQPLYENAVKHGVYESSMPINIQTNAHLSGNLLLIQISNNFENPISVKKKGAGIGLRNIRERLQLIFASDSLMNVVSDNGIFTVKLAIPQVNVNYLEQ